jgi:S1-C subfamily serine protease
MEIPVEKIAAELLKDMEMRKTPECLSVDILGEYIEHTLPNEEWDRVENHLRSCLYCLNQLVELRELLFLEKNAEPLPRSLERKLRRLATQETSSIWKGLFETFKEFATSALETTREIFSFRYTWQAVSGLSLAVVVFMYFGAFHRGPEDYAAKVAMAVGDSIVTVRGMDTNKATVRQGNGVVVDPRGFVVLPLHLVTEIASGEVTLASGVSLPIKGLIGADPESDLAVVELDTSSILKALKIADPGTIQAGERVVALSKVDHMTPQIADGVLGDTIPLISTTRGPRETEPGRVTRQFIPVGTASGGVRQGILVNLKGEVISVNTVSPEGEKIGLAMPIDNIEPIIKSPKTLTPLGELKYKSHPPEAVWYYVKALLAYDSRNLDEAIGYYEKCLQIDASYDPAHVLLGEMYHLKRDYEKEVSHYKEALRINPENDDAHFDLALSYEDQGDYGMAIKELEQVLTIEPSHEEARYNLGVDYLIIGKLDKAIQQYEALKKINEGAANKLKRLIDLALTKRGEVYFRDPWLIEKVPS